MSDAHEPFSLTVNDLYQFALEPAAARGLDVVSAGEGKFHVLKNGQAHELELVSADYAQRVFTFRSAGNLFEVKIADRYERLIRELGLSSGGGQKQNAVRAPMPGLVLNILVQPGQAVQKGDPLLILEAMKMENVLKAAADATVKNILVQKGVAVEKGQLLIEL